jgi:hypothetical protein
MAGCPPPLTRHNSAPVPLALGEELLLAHFALDRRYGAQPSLSPVYNGPSQVLERSTHFFLLEMGERTDKVSTLRLKAARTPDRYRASQAVTQGTPCCAGTACPRTAAVTAGASATGDIQPSTDIATNKNNHISIRPPASQCQAASPTQPLSLPPQSLEGTCGGILSGPLGFPP